MFDTIVIGGGPAGLIAAITASQGTPNLSPAGNRKGTSRVLVLEAFRKVGGIAAFGSLVLTDYWTIPGGKIKSLFCKQIDELPVEVVTQAKVSEIVRQADGFEVVVENGSRYFSKTVILACGIFPHLQFLKYKNAFFLATDLADQERFIHWADEVARANPEVSRRLLLVGSNASAQDAVQRWSKISKLLEIEVLIQSEYETASGSISELMAGNPGNRLKLPPESVASLTGGKLWNDGSAGIHTDYLGICFDYNSFKIRPESPARFIKNLHLKSKDGYIETDRWYRTSAPGIWACGNSVFPVSGVLQALYSGFIAGLSVRSEMSAASYDDIHGLLPWLPFPNSTWKEWL